MKAIKWFVLLLVVMVVTVTASMFAGDDHRCSASADECLKKMHQKLSQVGWLGIESEKDAQGRVVIARVVPGSPAEKAGFLAGDVLAAVGGVELGDKNKEKLAKTKQAMSPGSDVTYTVLRQGAKVELTARLAAMPREVMAQKIGEHLLAEHLQTTVATK